VRLADSHIGSWIAEFFGRLRHECVKSTEEASLKIGHAIWMFDRGLLNHVEHINFRRENFSEYNRIGRSIGGRTVKSVAKRILTNGNACEVKGRMWGPTVSAGQRVDLRIFSATEPMIPRSSRPPPCVPERSWTAHAYSPDPELHLPDFLPKVWERSRSNLLPVNQPLSIEDAPSSVSAA